MGLFYSSDSRTGDFLSNFRKNTAKNTTKPGNSPRLLHFFAIFCSSPGVTTVIRISIDGDVFGWLHLVVIIMRESSK